MPKGMASPRVMRVRAALSDASCCFSETSARRALVSAAAEASVAFMVRPGRRQQVRLELGEIRLGPADLHPGRGLPVGTGVRVGPGDFGVPRGGVAFPPAIINPSSAIFLPYYFHGQLKFLGWESHYHGIG